MLSGSASDDFLRGLLHLAIAFDVAGMSLLLTFGGGAFAIALDVHRYGLNAKLMFTASLKFDARGEVAWRIWTTG